MPFCRISQALDELQDGGVQGVVEVARLRIVAVHRQHILREVVAADRAKKLMRRMGIQYETHLLKGDPIDVIKKTAGDDHIIVMGASTKNPLIKFFTGSKPLKIMKNCPCPVLIIK